MNTKNKNRNYISKCMDLYFCLERFLDEKLKNNENVYLLDLNSWETSRSVFMDKIWKQFQSRINSNTNSKYNLDDGVGALEIDHNGNYHIHMLVTYKRNYAKQSIYNYNTDIRKLWLHLNDKYSHKELHGRRFASASLNVSARKHLTRYLAKPIKHRSGKFSYLAKDYDTQTSFRVVLGQANNLWKQNELPSHRYSNKDLTFKLTRICNERVYDLENLNPLQKKVPNVFTPSLPPLNNKKALVQGTAKFGKIL